MKTIAILFAATILFVSCKKSENVAAPTPVDTTFDVTRATLLKTGSFAGSGSYTVNGTVKLYSFNNKNYIQFTNFGCNNGPDLKVYIATNNSAAQFVSLGTLQSNTAATQTYTVAMPPDFSTHNKVLIWCQQFSVLFGTSTLQ